jgi:hypothetical protein
MPTPAERLEYLRGEIRAERISWGELAELQALAAHIESSDTELLEWAGVPEFPDDDPTPESRSARLTTAPDGATLAPIRTGIVHGPARRCEACPEPAMHVHGKRCAVHTFSPQMSGEPLPRRRGSHHCRHCGAAEAMPGHEC